MNAYHSRFKQWMRRFNGVATAYLPNCLGWFRALDRNAQSGAKPASLLALAVGAGERPQLTRTEPSRRSSRTWGCRRVRRHAQLPEVKRCKPSPDTNSPVDCLCLARSRATGPARPARGLTIPIHHCSGGPARRAAGVGCVRVVAGPMEAARRQGVARRRHPGRRFSAGLSTPNGSPPASKDRFKRIGRRVLPCSGCHGDGKRAFENPIFESFSAESTSVGDSCDKSVSVMEGLWRATGITRRARATP